MVERSLRQHPWIRPVIAAAIVAALWFVVVVPIVFRSDLTTTLLGISLAVLAACLTKTVSRVNTPGRDDLSSTTHRADR